MRICFKLGFIEVFLSNMGMSIPVWREIGMGKIPHSAKPLVGNFYFITPAKPFVGNWECAIRDSWGICFSLIRGFATHEGKPHPYFSPDREWLNPHNSLWNPFHSGLFPLDWCGTLFWTKKFWIILLILSEKQRISNFRMWIWGMSYSRSGEK